MTSEAEELVRRRTDYLKKLLQRKELEFRDLADLGTMSKVQGSGSMKFEAELFDRKNNFSLWKSTVKDLLVQQGLIKTLYGVDGKPPNISDEDWKELELKAISTIRLTLAPEVKCNVLNETSPLGLWEKFEEIYMSKTLTSHLFLKKQLYELRMEEGTDIYDHLNTFIKLVTQLMNVEVKLEEEDIVSLLFSSLPPSYHDLVMTLTIGKETIKVEEVIAMLMKNEKFKNPSGMLNEDGNSRVKGVRGGSATRGNNDGRPNSDSRHKVDYSDKECYYCREKGHIQFYCKKKKEDLEELGKNSEKNEKGKEKASVNVFDDSDDKESLKNSWIFSSSYSFHVSKNKEWFDTYEACDGGSVFMANGNELKIKGIGSVKVKLHDGSVKMLSDVRHVLELTTNLVSLGRLDSLGYGYSIQGGVLTVNKGSVVVMKAMKTSKNLYKLMGSTVQVGVSNRIDGKAYRVAKG